MSANVTPQPISPELSLTTALSSSELTNCELGSSRNPPPVGASPDGQTAAAKLTCGQLPSTQTGVSDENWRSCDTVPVPGSPLSPLSPFGPWAPCGPCGPCDP